MFQMFSLTEDWRADGYLWRQNGNGKFTLDGIIAKVVYFKVATGRDEATNVIQYSNEFKRTIYHHPMIENRVLIEYIGDEKIVTDFEHGNAKTTQKLNASFIPTARSVKRASKALDAKPCKLYRKLVNKASRHLARHRTNAPRNQKQVANSQYERKKQRTSRDGLYNLLCVAADTGFIKRYMVYDSEKNMFTKSKHRFSHHVQNIFVRKRFFK